MSAARMAQKPFTKVTSPKSRMSANSIIPADILLNKNYMKLLLKKPIAGAIGFCGAAYEARTRYLHLGKVALYRMS